ncbi:hypothetical protein Tco_1576646 [Tanacetum coccineum]
MESLRGYSPKRSRLSLTTQGLSLIGIRTRWGYYLLDLRVDSNSPIIEYHMNPKNICEDTPRSSRCALCRASEQSDTAATALQCRSPNVSSLQI